MEKEHDIKVRNSSADADYDIVKSACDIALSGPVVVVGDDTDLLIMLLHHFAPDRHKELFMKTATKIINIRILQETIGMDLSQSLLFIHALTGGDVTSWPYGIGKVSALEKWSSLQEYGKCFILPGKTQEEIEKTGQQALGVVYGCVPGNDLDFERAARFSKKVVTSSSYIPPERLPPTTDAARYHSRRVYHLVQTWLGNNMDATQWGWVVRHTQNGRILKPQKMDQAAAPSTLLKIIKCNCMGNCDKNTCSCRKNGLNCTLACGNCKGLTCSNAGNINDPEEV